MKPDGDKNFVDKNAEPVKSKIFVQNEWVVSPSSTRDVIEKFQSVMIGTKVKSLRQVMEENDNPDMPFQGWRVNVVTWADVDSRTYMCWGDYWVKKQMENHLKKMGCVLNVGLEEADVSIYLFGSPFNYRPVRPYQYNPLSYNVVWFYSHPDKMNVTESAKYDYLFCLSEPYIEKIKKQHFNVHPEPLLSCTDFKQPDVIKYGEHRDIVMVANARGAGAPYGRQIVKLLTNINLKGLKVSVWGHKWNDSKKYHKFPSKWYKGQYWDYNQLPELYRGAKAVLIDGHTDMEREGFVPMKLFDIFASGGLPIIHKNPGIKKIFGDYVLQYRDEESLHQCITILSNKEKCLRIIKRGQKIALQHTFKDRVNTIMNTIRDNVVKSDALRGDSRAMIFRSSKTSTVKRTGKIEWVGNVD